MVLLWSSTCKTLKTVVACTEYILPALDLLHETLLLVLVDLLCEALQLKAKQVEQQDPLWATSLELNACSFWCPAIKVKTSCANTSWKNRGMHLQQWMRMPGWFTGKSLWPAKRCVVASAKIAVPS